ncbi:hypothetical protein NPIL_201951, partial [Nephila pilipes]
RYCAGVRLRIVPGTSRGLAKSMVTISVMLTESGHELAESTDWAM